MSYTNGLDNPQLYFQTKLYTGDGNSTQAITLDGDENMQPDWIWIKNRTDGHYHNLNDSVRGVGATKVLRSNTNGAEGGTSGHVSVIGSDGFTVAAGTSDSEEVNTSSDNYVAWNWKAGGSASSNTDGSITSSVSANTTAGFSIVSYTGTGANATVGHGLGAVPQMIIVKNRDGGTDNWAVYHEELGANNWLKLNTNDASATDTVMWNNTTPTSSVFSVGTYTNSNGNTNGMLAYCFSDIKGYSKFGSYTGNGNADGTFVYLGFKPAFIIFKRTNTTNDWFMVDNKINPFNVTDKMLRPNLSNAEQSFNNIDFLSNGFKPRGASDGFNASGSTYIYMCFASSPFTTSTGIPTTAR